MFRVGYEPDPWVWVPWEYGPFTGRWDDPEDIYRVLYAGSTPEACFLEVLAQFRADAGLGSDFDDIAPDPEDEAYPTVAPGTLERSWLEHRRLGSARLTGAFVAVLDSTTISALRPRFLGMAIHYGLADFDASGITVAEPRAFTQKISRFLYVDARCTGGAVPAGIAYRSRHGFDQQLWAIFERDPADSDRSPYLSGCSEERIPEIHPALLVALPRHRLTLRIAEAE